MKQFFLNSCLILSILFSLSTISFAEELKSSVEITGPCGSGFSPYAFFLPNGGVKYFKTSPPFTAIISNMPTEEAQTQKAFYDRVAKVAEGNYSVVIKPPQKQSECDWVEDPSYPIEGHQTLMIISNRKNMSDFHDTARELETFAEITQFFSERK